MDDPLQMVQSKGSRLKKNHQVEVVIFNNRPKSIRKPAVESKSRSTNDNLEFSIKDATKEVIKLGAKGFYQRRRDRTLKSFAVELGAKPEKRRYHNYKELKNIKKARQEHQEKRLTLLKESSGFATFNHYKRKKTQKSKRKSDISILNSYGKKK